MPTITLNFRPASLDHNTTVNIILPEKINEETKTLWLLHGMYGDHTSWTNGSSVGRYVRGRNIAVVMPAAENSFYTNMVWGGNYYDYVSRDLPEFIQSTFRLSADRDKNFIAGLSMGGYGAFKLALRNPDRYFAAASLSGCVNIMGTLGRWKTDKIAVSNWGENFVENVRGTDEDLMHRIETYPADAPKVKLFATCGTEDFLYADNIVFTEFMKDKEFDYSFLEGPGAHTWQFWDEWLIPAINHMLGE